MENIIIAIITGIVAIIISVIGIQQRKNTANITKNKTSINDIENSSSTTQAKLIETLNNTVEAQSKQIEILRGIVDEQRIQLKEKDMQLEELTKRVSNLEQLTIEQALIISRLERYKERQARYEGGETQTYE